MRVIILITALMLSFSLFGNTKEITVKGVTISIPSTWTQSATNKTLWTDKSGNSVNIVSENVEKMTHDAYVRLSLQNMKKMLPSYKVISHENAKGVNVNYTAYLGEYSLKDIGAPSGNIRLYSIFLKNKGLKYVVTIGGLPEQFKEKNKIFKSIMASIKLDPKYKEVIDNAGGVRTIDGKISIEVPKGWNKKDDKDMWVDPSTYSSVNVTKENTPQYKLEPYLDLSLTNMKKAINTYVLIKKEIRTINGNKVGILLGKFTMSNMKLRLYSVVIDLNGMKYVLSIGGPSKSFDALNSTFNKIINSLKKI